MEFVLGSRHQRSCIIAIACGLTTTLGAAPAAAAEQTVRLTFHGATVKRGTRSAVETVAQMPGFECSGYHGVTNLKSANPAPALRIVDNHLDEGWGFQAFDGGCKTPGGLTFYEEETEGGRHAIFGSVRITPSAITETFPPGPIIEDPETKCRWKISSLSGPLPSSGVLAEVHVSGTAKLQAFSAKSCPKTPQPVAATLTVDDNEEGEPIGAYAVEVL